MGRLFKTVLSLVTSFFVASMLAILVCIGWMSSHGWLTPEKLDRMMAVAKTEGPLESPPPTTSDELDNPEQASYDDILRQRALKLRDLELRENVIATRFANLRAEQAKLLNENDRLQLMKNAFQHELLAMREGALSASQENARLIVENMKPKQAKDQLMLMIAKKELNETVALLAAMPIAVRKKIFAEFKEGPEIEAVADILRLIRQGAPEVPVIDKQQQQLNETLAEDP